MTKIDYSYLHDNNFNLLFYNLLGKDQLTHDFANEVESAALFVTNECRRAQKLDSSKKSHNVTRGRVPSPSQLRKWAITILEQCVRFDISPPYAVVDMFYVLLKCNYAEVKQTEKLAAHVKKMHEEKPKLSRRQLAKEVGRDVATIQRWLKKEIREFAKFEVIWYSLMFPDDQISEIANKFNITPQAFTDILKDKEVIEFIKIFKNSEAKIYYFED